MIPMAMLGFIIFATPRLAYGYYAHVPRPFGPAPLADQHLAGILMWSTSMVLSVAWLIVAGNNWFQAEERRTSRAERPGTLLPGASA
jgi:cytochrome c oxidase assembly factor CtaG